MNLPRVYADFQHLDDENRFLLDCHGTAEDLAKLGISLAEGLVLTFYTDDVDENGQQDDLLVDGVVQFDPEAQRLVGVANWGTMRHASRDARLNGTATKDTQRNGSTAPVLNKEATETP